MVIIFFAMRFGPFLVFIGFIIIYGGHNLTDSLTTPKEEYLDNRVVSSFIISECHNVF